MTAAAYTQGPRIELAYPVKPESPPWVNDDGLDLRDLLIEWLDSHANRLVPLQDAEHAIWAGQFCGLFAESDAPGELCPLLTLQAVTSFVAESGLEAATVAMLHHHLFELTTNGDLARNVVVVDLPILGPTWCYRISNLFWVSE